MIVQDVFTLAMRWAHALAALLWIGGALFYALVLRPAQQRTQEPQSRLHTQAIAQEFRSWVYLAIGVLVISGAVLTLARLASGVATPAYLLFLGLKVLLALITFLLFFLVRAQQRRRASPSPQATGPGQGNRSPWARARGLLSGPNLILVLGVTVFLLADVLRYLVERGLPGS
ncbi:MAG: hypothetical protein EXR55_06485 [Dehalococcoidia bacterium]|nr:hypothetical protein [Dehalococcoidia bacterium]